MIRQVRRAITEAAISHLHVTYLDCVETSEGAPKRGRILTSSTALGSYDSESASKQGCFFRMISIVEAYVDIITSSLFRERIDATDDLVQRLVINAELRASTTWYDRKNALSQYHQIKVGEFTRWYELDAGIEVRNAIAHGLGRLTRRQRQAQTESKVSQIGVSVRDGSIVIDAHSLKRCRDVCIDSICYLDTKCQPQSS
jgi:hypothetical protein